MKKIILSILLILLMPSLSWSDSMFNNGGIFNKGGGSTSIGGAVGGGTSCEGGVLFISATGKLGCDVTNFSFNDSTYEIAVSGDFSADSGQTILHQYFGNEFLDLVPTGTGAGAALNLQGQGGDYWELQGGSTGSSTLGLTGYMWGNGPNINSGGIWVNVQNNTSIQLPAVRIGAMYQGGGAPGVNATNNFNPVQLVGSDPSSHNYWDEIDLVDYNPGSGSYYPELYPSDDTGGNNAYFGGAWTFVNTPTAPGYNISGGLSSQFLTANGSYDGSTGSGNVVLATSPTLVTPILGTPTSVTLNNTSDVIGIVKMTLGSDASYDMYYRNSSGNLTRLANGTTGQVLTATTSNAPSWAAASGGGFGGQHVVTGSRALTTIYQNTTGKTMFVAVSVSVGTSVNVIGYTDSSATPTTVVAESYIGNAATPWGNVYFMVLNNNYYEVVPGGSGTLQYWVEWY